MTINIDFHLRSLCEWSRTSSRTGDQDEPSSGRSGGLGPLRRQLDCSTIRADRTDRTDPTIVVGTQIKLWAISVRAAEQTIGTNRRSGGLATLRRQLDCSTVRADRTDRTDPTIVVGPQVKLRAISVRAAEQAKGTNRRTGELVDLRRYVVSSTARRFARIAQIARIRPSPLAPKSSCGRYPYEQPNRRMVRTVEPAKCWWAPLLLQFVCKCLAPFGRSEERLQCNGQRLMLIAAFDIRVGVGRGSSWMGHRDSKCASTKPRGRQCLRRRCRYRQAISFWSSRYRSPG